MLDFFYPQSSREVFTDRRAVLSQLNAAAQRMAEGKPQQIAIFGPRRIGKTLLLKEYIFGLLQSQRQVVPIFMDFQELCISPELFVAGFIGQIFYWLYERGSTNPQYYFSLSHVLKKAIQHQDPLAIETVERVQNQLEKNTPDRFYLLTLAFNFPQELALATGCHLLLIWDEFQTIEVLNNYPGLGNVLGLFRAAMQRQGDVSYILSGSAISTMNKILSDHHSPLFAQFDKLSLAPFNEDSTRELVLKLLPEITNPDLHQEIYRLTCGNPFYITQLCSRVRDLAQTMAQLDKELIRTAFLIECLSKEGKIYDYCRYIYDLSLHQARGFGALKNILHLLAQDEGQTTAELARKMRVSHQTAREYLRSLLDVDLLVQREKRYFYADPILRYWVANVGQGIDLEYLPSEELLCQLIPRLVEQFHRTSSELGAAKESEIRELLRFLSGKEVSGKLLGTSTSNLQFPCFEEIIQYRSKDGQIEVDCLASTDSGGWAVEVKWRTKIIGVKEIQKFQQKCKGIAQYLWFISRSGFTEKAQAYCKEQGIYFTDERALTELQKQTGLVDK